MTDERYATPRALIPSGPRTDVIQQCVNHVLENDIAGSLVQFEAGNSIDDILPNTLGRRVPSRRIFSLYTEGSEAELSFESGLEMLDARQWRRVDATDIQVFGRIQTLRIAFARVDTRKFPLNSLLLSALYPRITKGGFMLLERCSREELLPVRRFLKFNGGFSPFEMLWRVDEDTFGLQKIEPEGEIEIERYDYTPPNFRDPSLRRYFPSALPVNPWTVNWPYLRPSTPHIYRSDCRYEGPFFIGNASYEEAVCLFEVARQFEGKRGLEIGSHFGWTSAHLQAAGLDMDYIDPAFSSSIRQEQIAEVLRAVGGTGKWEFWSGTSPELVPIAFSSDPRPYSFVFIDGDHDGLAPVLDALKVAQHCADDAIITFHDMASPQVAQGLSSLRERGWSTCIFNTMQILGFAWRGNVIIPQHVPDPNTTPLYEPHLNGWL